MRIDKFLKVARLIKRRTIAKEVLDLGLIKINGKVVKPSCEVQTGDEIELLLGQRKLIVKVISLAPYISKENTNSLYKVLSDEVIKTSC